MDEDTPEQPAAESGIGPADEQQSPQAWQQRYSLIFDLCCQHLMCATFLHKLGIFPSQPYASRVLRRLERKKKIKLAATIRLKQNGRPEHWFTKGWAMSPANGPHEAWLSIVLIRLNADKLERRNVNKTIRPDAEVWIDGARYFVELDMNQESYGQVVNTRYPKYVNTSDAVLWIVHDDSPGSAETRKEGLRTRCQLDNCFFTTSYAFLKEPYGEGTFVDRHGDPSGIPKVDPKPGPLLSPC